MVRTNSTIGWQSRESFILTNVFSRYTLFSMHDKISNLHGKFRSIIELTTKLDKSPKRFGTDNLLTHSEIHLIEIIGVDQDQGVTDISKRLGITKGAVSQSLKKLELKGYSVKEQDPENLSRSLVRLTTKGKTAYWAHKQWHESMDGGFQEYLGGLRSSELDTIIEFLNRVEDFLTRRLETDE